jgi:hypothetical protein
MHTIKAEVAVVEVESGPQNTKEIMSVKKLVYLIQNHAVLLTK